MNHLKYKDSGFEVYMHLALLCHSKGGGGGGKERQRPRMDIARGSDSNYRPVKGMFHSFKKLSNK